MVGLIKIYIYGCLIFFLMPSVLCAMESLNTPTKDFLFSQAEHLKNFNQVTQKILSMTEFLKNCALSIDGSKAVDNGQLVFYESTLGQCVQELDEYHYFLTSEIERMAFSIRELAKECAALSEENKKLLLTQRDGRNLLLDLRLRIGEVIMVFFETLELTYLCHLTVIKNKIERIDGLFKNSTDPKETKILLLTEKEDLLKALMMLEGNEKEILLRKNKIMIVIEDYKPDLVKTGEKRKNLELDNLEVEYLDKETHELGCSLQ
ncbi:hypothetical protein H0X06_04455 [Candidatus Dependentiae bacterium]|nr:hypothetical protein [Candidatus Dependentiae bacterium]